MASKKWILIWLLIISTIPMIGILNYIVDPYGLHSNKNKFAKYLTTNQATDITNLKINLKANTYLVGTSRLRKVDPNLVESHINTKVYNVNIPGATLIENIILTSKIKTNNNNVIFGFDVFSLNKSNLLEKNIIKRYEKYKNILLNDNIYYNFFTISYLKTTLKDISNRLINRNLNQYLIEKDNLDYNYTINDIETSFGFLNNKKVNMFTNFETFDNDEIVNFAKQLTKKDIIVIYPQHYYYYYLFQKHQNIEQKYFNAIKLLVKNTKAKVWSFYQINEVTMNSSNFDNYGWHFKARVSKLIFAKIFNDNSVQVPKDFGILLTNDNIEKYFKDTHESIKILSLF